MKKSLSLFIITLSFCFTISAQEFSDPILIDTNVINYITFTELVDLDEDGDLDLMSFSSIDDKGLFWQENDGAGNFGNLNLILPNQDLDVRRGHFHDIDSDGDMDYVYGSCSSNQIAWLEREDATFISKHIISYADCPTGVHIEDLDGDGDKDIIYGSIHDEEVAWLENLDGQGSFGSKTIIIEDAGRISRIIFDDLDGDENKDIVISDYIAKDLFWYKGIGNLTFGSQQMINDNVYVGGQLKLLDVDNNGQKDIITENRYGFIEIYRKTVNNFYFNDTLDFNTDISAIEIYDYNEDGIQDLILGQAKPNNQTVWVEGFHEPPYFNSIGIIDSLVINGARQIFFADIDNDLNTDIIQVAGSVGEIEIAKKTSTGFEPFYFALENPYIDIKHLLLFDADGDGDEDMITGTKGKSNLLWYERLEYPDLFAEPRVISNNDTTGIGYTPVDLDSDGDMDLLAFSETEDLILLYENRETEFPGERWKKHIIQTASPNHTISNLIGDYINDDDRMDILFVETSFLDADAYVLLQNAQGQFQFTKYWAADVEYAKPVRLGDVDNDGDLDIIASAYYFLDGDFISYYKNNGGFFDGNNPILINDDFDSPNFKIYDLDHDGDTDIIIGKEGKISILWRDSGWTEEVIVQSSSFTGSFALWFDDRTNDGIKDMVFRYNWNYYLHEGVDDEGTFLDPVQIPDQLSGYFIDINNDGLLDNIWHTMQQSDIYYRLQGGIPALTTSATVDEITCEEGAASINVQFEGGAPPYTIAWSDGATDFMYNVNNIGTYAYTITDQASQTVTDTIEVESIGESLNISTEDINPSQNNQPNGSISITTSGGIEPISYNWNTGDTTSSINSLVTGFYNLTIIDGLGCTIEREYFIDTELNVNTLQQVGIVIFPNPARAIINVEQNSPNTLHSFKIYDSTGSVKLYSNSVSQYHSINTESLNSGIHYIKLRLHSGKEIIQKIVIL